MADGARQISLKIGDRYGGLVPKVIGKNHNIYTQSEKMANTNDSKSLSDIFAWCGRTINPLLENTRSTEKSRQEQQECKHSTASRVKAKAKGTASLSNRFGGFMTLLFGEEWTELYLTC